MSEHDGKPRGVSLSQYVYISSGITYALLRSTSYYFALRRITLHYVLLRIMPHYFDLEISLRIKFMFIH